MEENLFNSIKVRIPRNMLVLKKNGKVSMVRSMTTSGNIKKIDGKPSIILEEGENVKPSILDNGKYRTLEDFKQYPLMAQAVSKISNFKHPKVIEHVEHIDSKPIKEKVKKQLVKYVAVASPKPERLIKAEPDYKISPIGTATQKPVKIVVRQKLPEPTEMKSVERGEIKLKPTKVKGTASLPLYPFFEEHPSPSAFDKKKKKKK